MISITPSHIIEYLYCPRYTYFEYVVALPQFEEKFYKAMKGRGIHEEKLVRNKDYLRSRIGVVEKYLDQYLTNSFIRGRLDEVLLLEDGSMAPLDYKFAEYKDKVYKPLLYQLYCYAWLIEENYHKPVHKGFLVFIRSKNKLIEIPISQESKDMVKRAALEVGKIIELNYFPPATKEKKKCLICTYRNVCNTL